MSKAKYIIGIDLGTTHSVVAYTEAELREGEESVIRIFAVPQVISPGEVKAKNSAAVFFVSAGTARCPGGEPGSALEAGCGCRGGRICPKAGGGNPQPAGIFRQVVAVSCRSRPHPADPPLGQPGRRPQSFAGGGFLAVFAAPGGRLELPDGGGRQRSPVRAPGHLSDRSGVV